jgi:hypothetical protein
MSDSYVEKEDETTLTIFNKRIIYDFESQDPNYTNLVDFNIGEKFLYGRVARDFKPIYFKDKSNLKTFSSSLTNGSVLQAANFVVDMFNRLSSQFDKCSTIGKIKSDDPFLSSLRVYKAFQDPVELHGAYLQNYLNTINRDLRKTNFNSLEQFIVLLENRLQDSLQLYPITFSGFVKSRFCPISVSGISIEIADANYFNDNRKIEEFINSPNWKFYLNACRSYGFMIDKLIPWRLVADIGTKECIEYASEYDLEGTNFILQSLYEETDLIFFNKLKFYLLNLYNQNTGVYAETYQCDGRIKTRYKNVEQININKFNKVMSEKQLLNFYLKMRIIEEDKKLTSGQQTRLIKDTMAIYDIKGLRAALRLFSSIVVQPFDSSGSLSYLNRARKLREDT